MPSLVVTGQQTKEKQRGGHNVPPPDYMVPKDPSHEKLISLKQLDQVVKKKHQLLTNRFKSLGSYM